MKRKIVALLLACTMVTSLYACGGSGTNDSNSNAETQTKEKEYVDDINAVATQPDSYKGKYIKFYGMVSTVETTDDFYGVQVYIDLDYNNSVLLEIPKDIMAEAPQPNDFLDIDAEIEDSKDGQTVMGVNSTWAYLVADSVEKTTYIESFGKANTTWEFSDKAIEQNGVIVDVTKVEFAENETRFYVTATNNSSDTMNIWAYSAKVIQNGQQHDQTYGNYYGDYPEISTDIIPGASSSGIIVFDAIEPSDMQLYIDGASDNWELDFSPFIFDLAQ